MSAGPLRLGPFCIINTIIDDEVHKVADCCPPTYSCCDGECVNLQDDDTNCGARCNDRKTCAAGQLCRHGACGCLDPCLQGQLCIDGNQLCATQNGVGCQCGCGPFFKYCPNHHGGACVSEHSPVC